MSSPSRTQPLSGTCRITRLCGLLASLTLGLAPQAQAGMFNPKTSMDEWTERKVDQDFVLPKGWLKVAVDADFKHSTSYRDSGGFLNSYDDETAWDYGQLWLRIDQGFSSRVRLYAHVPMVWASLRVDDDHRTTTRAMGDVHTGMWLQPWREQGPVKPSSAALQLDLKAPSGVEWPSDLIGGGANTESFLTGTGVPNLGAHLHGRTTVGASIGLAGSIGYVRKFPVVVGYVIEQGGFGNGWINPGDELLVTGRGLFQATDDLAAGPNLSFSRRGTYAMGTSGSSPTGVVLEDIADSDGTFTDVGLTASWSPGSHWEVNLDLGAQLLGSDTRTFAHLGLEEFSPQPGVTTGLEVAARW
ncbi:MAG: hypothetical protein QGG40_15160 [Myxococcota bacterium]|jgi:hypothetical protein|nr:hypothetical protein [Myxococcota bacterium]